MKTSNAVETIAGRLVEANYQRMPSSFRLTTAVFEFGAVLAGRAGRSNDLVVVVDTSEDEVGTRGLRLRQRLDALTLAIDVMEAGLVVTCILVGPPLPSETVEEISRSCRVLAVSPATLARDVGAPALDDRLSVLLPLHVGIGGDIASDPVGQVSRDVAAGSQSSSLASSFINASARGEDEVRRLLASALEDAALSGLSGKK